MTSTTNKKELFGGIILLAGFMAVLIAIFMPLYHGQNGLNYLDNLFNSISKGSAYYIDDLTEKVKKTEMGKQVSAKLTFNNEAQAAECALLFKQAGATAEVDGTTLKVAGDFGKILETCLADTDLLFYNDGEKLQAKYGMEGRKCLFNWWTSLKSMQKDLNKQEKFEEGTLVYSVMTKGVECAYNYYKIVPEKITDRMGTVLFALIFYVIYTLWYGYAILFIFEGSGLQISH